jgi:hypothetical protein
MGDRQRLFLNTNGAERKNKRSEIREQTKSENRKISGSAIPELSSFPLKFPCQEYREMDSSKESRNSDILIQRRKKNESGRSLRKTRPSVLFDI